MTNKELREKIARLETELAEVKEIAEAMKKKADGGLFKPKDGQEFWFISKWGEVYGGEWDNEALDQEFYSIGNCFPTEQSAEDTMRVLELIQKARESQDGFVPDWEDDAQTKYFLNFHMGDIGITDYYSVNIAPTFGYWEDESACEQFIQDNHDELIWFFTEYRR